MFLTSSILTGFIRFCLIILFIFYLNKKFVSATKPSQSINFNINTWFKYSKSAFKINFLDFIIINWFRFGSILLVIIFGLVQFKIYNFFNTLFLLLIFVLIDLIGIKNIPKLVSNFKSKLKKKSLKSLKNIENNKPVWQWFLLKSKKSKVYYDNLTILIITIFLGGITFLSRYYFINFDNYSLSDAWINDLSKVIQIDLQNWFSDDYTINGVFSLVNFYSHFVNIGPEVALRAIAILESTLLAVMIYWVINKLTYSKYIAPIIAAFSFSLLYIFTPLNVYFLLKVNPTFMALTFTLPAFVYYIRPNLIRIRKFTYTLNYTLAFVAIGLIDLFTLCVLVFPFLLIGIVFTKYKYKIYNLLAFFSYILALGILYLIYYTACYYQGIELVEFIQSNLILVSSYTYIPQLILSYDIIILYIQYSTIISTILILILLIFKKENWNAGFIFFLYFNFLILLTFIKNEWIDSDMIKNSLVVLIPIILGFNVAIIVRIFNLILFRFERFQPVTITILILSIIVASIYYQVDTINKLTVSDQTPKQILDAYDKIDKTFLTKSFTVVNDSKTQVISINRHFFMNYEYFLNDYPALDSIYFKNYKKPGFLDKNPEYELSKSILVFVLNDKSKRENHLLAQNKNLNSSLRSNLSLLKKRGRKIKLFYDSDILKVYEIINEPYETKMSEIIFKL